MIQVTINVKTGQKTIVDLGPHPKDYDWIPAVAKMLVQKHLKEAAQ